MVGSIKVRNDGHNAAINAFGRTCYLFDEAFIFIENLDVVTIDDPRAFTSIYSKAIVTSR